MPPRPVITSIAPFEVSELRTTHVQVTSILYVTASIAPIEASRSTALSQKSVLGSPRSRPPAPDATGVVYQFYRSPTTSEAADESGTPNYGTIIGGILGGLAFLVLCLVIVARRRNKTHYQKRSVVKKGSSSATQHMSTNVAIDEACRRRKERNRRERADMAERVHQGNVTVATQHVQGSYKHVISRPVAVAVLNVGHSRTVRSDRPDSATLPDEVFDDVDLSNH